MKNILSFKPGTKFLGKEILDWARYQVENKTSHWKQGVKILSMYGNTLKPDRKYYVSSSYETFGCGDFRHTPIVRRSRTEYGVSK